MLLKSISRNGEMLIIYWETHSLILNLARTEPGSKLATHVSYYHTENFKPSSDRSFIHCSTHHSVDMYVSECPTGVWACWGRLCGQRPLGFSPLFLPGPSAGSVSGWALPSRGSWPTGQLSPATPDMELQWGPFHCTCPLGELFVFWKLLRNRR